MLKKLLFNIIKGGALNLIGVAGIVLIVTGMFGAFSILTRSDTVRDNPPFVLCVEDTAGNFEDLVWYDMYGGRTPFRTIPYATVQITVQFPEGALGTRQSGKAPICAKSLIKIDECDLFYECTTKLSNLPRGKPRGF